MGRRLRSMLDDELDDLDRSLDSQVEDLGSISPMAQALDDATAPAQQASVEQQTTAERQLAEYQASRQARDLPVFSPAQQSAGKKGGQS